MFGERSDKSSSLFLSDHSFWEPFFWPFLLPSGKNLLRVTIDVTFNQNFFFREVLMKIEGIQALSVPDVRDGTGHQNPITWQNFELVP